MVERLLVAVVVCLGCGPQALAPEAQRGVCDALLPQLSDDFACRVVELTGGAHAVDVDVRYTVDLHLAPDGRVERFRGLRPLAGLTDRVAPAPDCVGRSLLALHAAPRPTPALVPLGLWYRRGATPRAGVRDGRCWVTLNPLP